MSGESTPLFWLPEEEQKAAEIVALFLAGGADAGFRRKQDGLTAADVARRRGLTAAADILAAAAGGPMLAETAPPPAPASVQKYESLAQDLVTACASGDVAAMQRINEHYGRSETVDDVRATVWRLIYKVRRAKGAAEAFQAAEAQELIARTAGFPNWTALTEAAAKGAPPPGPAYAVNPKENKISPRRILTDREWDDLLAVMRERRIPALDANGGMTDEVLKRIAELDFVTGINLEGSRQVSDDGLQHLARMPQLQRLNVTGSKLTDRGLEVLRHLPNLRDFQMTWQKNVSDAGAANLRFCEQLESVNLMGSPTGDGAIDALRGKPNLRVFRSGRQVTDAGLALLHEFPQFKKWQGGDIRLDLMGPSAEPNHLLLDGPFSDHGLAGLAGLEGLFGLTLFWHVTGIASAGLAALVNVPQLGHFRCDGSLVNDETMRHLAAMPRLRMLVAQGSAATDDGFIALSQSRTLEYFWGREAPKLTGRGFAALSQMPALRGLGVSCKQVDDQALALLPRFPALRELAPIDVDDAGFRHVGRCQQLQRLWFMYCRDTTDAATEHIAGLSRLELYYAGLTGITDRSLELLGRMTSLESIEFYECKGVSDAGLVFLAGLPRLREVSLHGLPKVTPGGTAVFPAQVRVDYSV